HTRSKRDWSSDVCSSDLNDKEKQTIKEQFHLAQKNESPMWQDVISFDNEWLVKQGLYNAATHTVDETKMRSVVREAMNAMLQARSEERRVGKEGRGGGWR